MSILDYLETDEKTKQQITDLAQSMSSPKWTVYLNLNKKYGRVHVGDCIHSKRRSRDHPQGEWHDFNAKQKAENFVKDLSGFKLKYCAHCESKKQD